MITGSIGNDKLNIKPAFQGSFKDGIAIQKAIECASDFDVYHFGQNIKRMKKVNDGRTFYLDRFCFSNSTTVREDVKLTSYQQNAKSTSQLVGQVIEERSNSTKDKCFQGVLRRINFALEEMYPIEKKTNVKRAKSLKTINRNLD